MPVDWGLKTAVCQVVDVHDDYAGQLTADFDIVL